MTCVSRKTIRVSRNFKKSYRNRRRGAVWRGRVLFDPREAEEPEHGRSSRPLPSIADAVRNHVIMTSALSALRESLMIDCNCDTLSVISRSPALLRRKRKSRNSPRRKQRENGGYPWRIGNALDKVENDVDGGRLQAVREISRTGLRTVHRPARSQPRGAYAGRGLRDGQSIHSRRQSWRDRHGRGHRD